MKKRTILALMELAIVSAPALGQTPRAVSRAKSPASFMAGAGKAQIALTEAMLPINGFTSILDPLFLRVTLVGTGRPEAAIVVVDMTSLSDGDVDAIKGEVAQVSGVARGRIWVSVSHTFSAPHLFGANPPVGMRVDPAEQARTVTLRNHVLAAAREAGLAGLASFRPARLSVGFGASQVNISRNHPSAKGWWLGANEAGYVDRTLGLARIADRSGATIASLVNFAVQSSVMDQTGAVGGGKAVSADLAGAAMNRVEAELGGVASFLIGAAGDQMPSYTARPLVYNAKGEFHVEDLGPQAYPLVRLQGERLADSVVTLTGTLKLGRESAAVRWRHGSVVLAGQERPKQLSQLAPAPSYTYVASQPTEVAFEALQLGELTLVGVKAELDAQLGAQIRQAAAGRSRFVATMVNGADKYLPTMQAYRENHYQAMNANYMPGSGERLVAAILKRLQKVSP